MLRVSEHQHRRRIVISRQLDGSPIALVGLKVTVPGANAIRYIRRPLRSVRGQVYGKRALVDDPHAGRKDSRKSCEGNQAERRTHHGEALRESLALRMDFLAGGPCGIYTQWAIIQDVRMLDSVDQWPNDLPWAGCGDNSSTLPRLSDRNTKCAVRATVTAFERDMVIKVSAEIGPYIREMVFYELSSVPVPRIRRRKRLNIASK